MRKPSQKTINLYNRLVENQNKVRNQLRRIHREAEEASGAGRLPALIIPKRAHKIRTNYFEGLSREELSRRLKAFYERLRHAKEIFANGLKSYLSKTVKQGYIDLWKDQILFISGESPEGLFGKFSKEQIEGSFMGEYMQVFNMLQSMSPETFLALLYTGKIIQFKYIYQDMISGMGEKENSWLQQQRELLAIYQSPKARKELFEGLRETIPSMPKVINKFTSSIEDEDAYSYSGRHTKKTIAKAQKAYDRRRK